MIISTITEIESKRRIIVTGTTTQLLAMALAMVIITIIRLIPIPRHRDPAHLPTPRPVKSSTAALASRTRGCSGIFSKFRVRVQGTRCSAFVCLYHSANGDEVTWLLTCSWSGIGCLLQCSLRSGEPIACAASH